jgi:cathepsin B
MNNNYDISVVSCCCSSKHIAFNIIVMVYTKIMTLLLVLLLSFEEVESDFDISEDAANSKEQNTEYSQILTQASSLPTTYDPRGIDNCIPAIYNQGSCGNCYAMAAAYVYMYRYCKLTGKKVVLSTQDITMCDVNNNNCVNGGQSDLTYLYMFEYGAMDNSCIPEDTSAYGKCTYSKCLSGQMASNKYYCKKGTAHNIYNKTYNSQAILTAIIKNEVHNNGAIAASLVMSTTLSYYYTTNSSSVYSTDDTTITTTNHVVSIIGWGEDYWIVANQYGTYWGILGFAKIKMGIRQIGYNIQFCEPLVN